MSVIIPDLLGYIHRIVTNHYLAFDLFHRLQICFHCNGSPQSFAPKPGAIDKPTIVLLHTQQVIKVFV